MNAFFQVCQGLKANSRFVCSVQTEMGHEFLMSTATSIISIRIGDRKNRDSNLIDFVSIVRFT